VQRRQAFKCELRPSAEQRRLMRRFAGACRFVYNRALTLQRERYERGESRPGYRALCRELTAWRASEELRWLRQSPTHPLQQALKNLERAWGNFFGKRAGLPRFKKRGVGDAFRYPDPKQFRLDQSNSRLFLPKLGWMRYRNSREVLGNLKNVTVSVRADRWFVSIQTEREVEAAVHPSRTAVGIDVGVARFATLSDGTYWAPLNSFKKHALRLRRYQRAMSRKMKFSQNWNKAKRRVQKLHARIGNCRRDYLHKTTHTISQNHALVCIEDLQVRSMSRSASGSVEAPGHNVRAKSALNKSILDQGWAEFRRQLQYKLLWRGGHLILVPPQNTSRACPSCRHTDAANRTRQAWFRCVECGFEAHADHVGAMNILARGHRVAACGEDRLCRPTRKRRPQPASAKQEPTEETMSHVAA
jgi:putative transposase